MRLKPNPQQTFLVLSMLFGKTVEEREPRLSDAPVKALKPTKLRKELEAAGVVRLEKRGRSSHLILQDEAWDFAVKHLKSDLPKTPRAAKVLEQVLDKLQLFLEAHDHSLADFVSGSSEAATAARARAESHAEEPGGRTTVASHESPDLEVAGFETRSPERASEALDSARDAGDSSGTDERAVREACLALAHGQTRRRVRLKDLRPMLQVERDSLDRTLLAMQTAGRLVLYKLDNPAEISPDDEHAALWIAGQPRHLVYLET